MSGPRTELTSAERRGYFAVVAMLPLLGASLGVNGGPVFQILAIENLGLDARQVGLAVGLGAISIPFQVMAARIPLRAAHRNLRAFIWSMAAMCLIMAWLITGPMSATVVIAAVIAIAVVAELAVSVLFATSFQPLLSTTVSTAFRQQINAQGRAVGGVLAIGLVGLVSWVGANGRVAILVMLALLGVVLARLASAMPRPQDDATPEAGPRAKTADDSNDAIATDDGDGLTWVYVAVGVSVAPAWPFVVTYASDTYWPAANLGAIGVALTIGSLAVSALWRPTDHGLVVRARVASVVLLVCAVSLVALDPSRSGWSHGAIVLLAIAVAAGAGAVVRLSLLEIAHLQSSDASTVAVLTKFDIIASTSMQLGFLAGGSLIDLSIGSTWLVDPFQLSLIAGSVLLVVAIGRVENRPTPAPP